MPYNHVPRQAALDASTQQFGEVLVAARTGKTIGITALTISCGTAMTVAITSGETLLWKAYVAANSGMAVRGPDGGGHWTCPIFESEEGQSIRVSTSAAGYVFISVLYEVTV